MSSNDYIYRQRLIWRSTRRAWLEVDICFSRFLQKHSLDSLTSEELSAYSYLVDLEDAKLMQLFQGVEKVDNPVIQRLVDMIRRSLVI